MMPDNEISVFDVVGESLGILWKAGTEAIRLRLDLHIRALEDIPRAAQRAGFQIFYIDLPMNVSGFARVIEGTPYIAVNRAKPSSHTKFTIAHELAHHQLHLNPSRNNDQAAQSSDTATEFEANMFATMLVASTTGGEQQEQLLAQNPEMRSSLAVTVFGTILAILAALVIWFCSCLFRTRDSALTHTI